MHGFAAVQSEFLWPKRSSGEFAFFFSSVKDDEHTQQYVSPENLPNMHKVVLSVTWQRKLTTNYCCISLCLPGERTSAAGKPVSKIGKGRLSALAVD